MSDNRPRRRTGTTLALAAATGGLLAAAMAGSPAARADDPYTDISTYVQNSVAIGESDYAAAGTDFSTPGDANEGLVQSFAGFDNIFVSPSDYTLLGLSAAATDTPYGSFSGALEITPSDFATTVAGNEADATYQFGLEQTSLTDATTALSGGDYFLATEDYVVAGYADILGGQADTLAGLFSLGL